MQQQQQFIVLTTLQLRGTDGLLYCSLYVRQNLNNVRSLSHDYVVYSELGSARPLLLNPVNTSNDAGNEKCRRLAA